MDKNIPKGLGFLLKYHKITGITYMGWSPNGDHSKAEKTLLILWNIFTLITMLFIVFINTKFIFDVNLGNSYALNSSYLEFYRNYTGNGDSILVFWLYNVGVISYTSQTAITCLFLIIFGSKLMENVVNDGIDRLLIAYEKKIGFSIIMIQIMIGMIFLASSLYANKDFYDKSPSYQLVLGTYLYCISLNTCLSALSLIAYKCVIVRQELTHILDLYFEQNLGLIFNSVHKILKSVKHFDNYISIYILISLFINMITIIAALCHIATNHRVRVTQSVCSLGFCFLQLLILCLICDIIPKSLRKLIYRIEDEKTSKGFDSYKLNDRQIIIHLKSLIPEMGFTAFGLFQINANTFLSCLAFIVSYSVIIIQTKT